MKKPLFFAGALLASLSLMPTLASAAAAPGPKARLFAKYDTNKNGLIDGDEMAALRKNFDAAPKGDLARFDTDHDGKLSDEEIAALRPPGAKKSGEKKSGGRKKTGAANQ